MKWLWPIDMYYIHLEYLEKTRNLKITRAQVALWWKEPMVHIFIGV
jgi:hypothetical protein